jgi:RNA polymerase sigma factor (sigma-70 family)
MTGQSERGPISDKKIVSASDRWSNESQSVEAIWHQFGEQFRRRARTRLRQYGLTGQAESMDICNDVMAEMAKGFNAKGVTPDDALAYVLRAIDNQVLDTFRRLARQCRDFRRNEPVPVDELPVANQGHSASQIALHREVIARIKALLNEEDALAVSMMLENRDWNEIGESLGVKPDTVRMRVRRALERVREEIGFRDGESDG